MYSDAVAARQRHVAGGDRLAVHDLRLDVERREVRQHLVERRARARAAAGESTTWSKFRRSALKWPATKNPNVSAAESIGVEKVEKNSAIAVTSISSTKMSAIALSSAGSSAGASHAAATSGSAPHAMYASTA